MEEAEVTEATETPGPALAGAPPTNTPAPPQPPSALTEREAAAAPEATQPAAQSASPPSGFLGASSGSVAVVLGLMTSLGLAGGVLGLWMWQTRRE